MMTYRLRGFKSRFVLAALASVVVLTVGFLWDGGQTPSRAAPEQNPSLQTVPPRPTETPDSPTNPPPEPPNPEPSANPPTQPSADENDDDDDSEAPPPGQPSEPDGGSVGDEAPLPDQPSGPDDGAKNEPPSPLDLSEPEESINNEGLRDQSAKEKEEDEIIDEFSVFEIDPDSTPDNHITNEDGQDSIQVTATLRPPSTASAPDNNLAATMAISEPVREGPVRSNEAGLLYWLYALILGVLLILIGLFLVSRT